MDKRTKAECLKQLEGSVSNAGLSITDKPWEDCDDGTRVPIEPGYRVKIGQWMIGTDTLRFERKRDAEAAMNALKRAGIETAEAAIEVGYKRMREIMCEALQW